LVTWRCHVLLAVVVVGDGCVAAVDDGDGATTRRRWRGDGQWASWMMMVVVEERNE
jgi:hypothetical protein